MWTKRLMWIADVGFILYWTTTAFHLLPAEWLYADHDNPLMVAWNWSFFPLDMLASITGLWALLRPHQSDTLKTMSLTLTMVAGGMAIGFWGFRGEFDLSWWLPNLYLLLFPIPTLWQLITQKQST